MLSEIRPALVALALFTLMTGVLYPLVVTGIAQVVFPSQANGSVLVHEGKEIGSALIGQPTSDPKYFWSRRSATGPQPFNGGASSGSNQGPTNPALVEAVGARVKELRDADPENRASIPVDLVTASGSGLDPHISPAAAEYQVRRVAKARNKDEALVRKLVAAHTHGRTLGVLGEPYVSVLELNLALDEL
ncbi:MAG TPA: potassium-transporting ATPase subunit KdpC [Polyangiaceae bacterium]|jgi:K+-transporting ATPase ATPase C chain|nr:potassium-transporting ATPase subunit KdpC [Polyangiaceae bacterium]